MKIKEKLFANKLPHKARIIAYILFCIYTGYILLYNENHDHNHNHKILYLYFATMFANIVFFSIHNKIKKTLIILGAYIISFGGSVLVSFCMESDETKIIALLINNFIILCTLITLIIIAANIRYDITDESYKANMLVSYKYSFYTYVIIFITGYLILHITDYQLNISLNSDILIIVALLMIIIQLIILLILECKFEKSLECVEDEEE